MQLTFLAAAALAAASFGSVAEPSSERCEIEVVFHDFLPAFTCDGCANSYTDSMATGDSYVCPNGDRWDFTVGTPTLVDAYCRPVLFTCAQSGACKFKRTGTLTFTDNGPGPCSIYYRADDDADYLAGSNGLQLTIESSVTCQAGSPGAHDCEFKTIEFYDSTNDDSNVVVMSWDVNFCCSKCPD